MNLRSILFENPYALVPCLLAVALVLLRVWNRRRTRFTGVCAAAGVVAVPAMVLVQAAVVTDNERVKGTCASLADAVGDADLAAIASHISADFRSGAGASAWDKRELLARCRRALTTWDVQEQRLSRFEITINGARASATFRATCRLISDQIMVARHVSAWKLELVRSGDSWLVRGITPVRSRWLPCDSLADLLR